MLNAIRRAKPCLFQALGHPTRSAFLELFRQGERLVRSLCDKVGVEQTYALQQLALLRNKHIIATRKVGNSVCHRPLVHLLVQVLENVRESCFVHWDEVIEVLREDQMEGTTTEQEINP